MTRHVRAVRVAQRLKEWAIKPEPPVTRNCWRMRALRSLPKVLLEGQFEVMVAFSSITSGLALVSGSVPPSMAPFPFWVPILYGAALLLGGLSLTYGLRSGGVMPPAAAGLRLCAIAFTVYGLAALFAFGFRGVPAGLFFIPLGLLCALRAFTITTSRRLLFEALRESDRE